MTELRKSLDNGSGSGTDPMAEGPEGWGRLQKTSGLPVNLVAAESVPKNLQEQRSRVFHSLSMSKSKLPSRTDFNFDLHDVTTFSDNFEGRLDLGDESSSDDDDDNPFS